jgi:hypothetical protein
MTIQTDLIWNLLRVWLGEGMGWDGTGWNIQSPFLIVYLVMRIWDKIHPIWGISMEYICPNMENTLNC